jgi:hypothetical protein
MVKLTVVLTAVGALALPAAQGMASSQRLPQRVAAQLLRQMNSGPDGKITRHVTCVPAGGRTLRCDLESVRATTIRAHVSLVGGTYRTTWEPLAG